MDKKKLMSLDELVAVINAGADALEEAQHRFPGRLQYMGTHKVVESTFKRKRVVALPGIEDIFLSTGWRVSANAETTTIGCQKFNTARLRKAVLRLCAGIPYDRGASASASSPAFMNREAFYATREGIKYREHILPWADADRLSDHLKGFRDEEDEE